MDAFRWFLRLLHYAVILAAATGVSFAGTTDPNTPDEKYVEFGKQFPFVVSLRNEIDCQKPECKKTHKQFASAVVIKPNWIVTAAHVVKDARDNTVIIDDKEHPLTYVVWHKDFEGARIGFHDIAVGYMPNPVMLEFYAPMNRDANEVGKAATISGFGMHGTFLTGCRDGDGKRRAGHNLVERAERAILICSPSRTNRFPLEFGIAPGDSGGGIFVGNKLVGINSFLMTDDPKPDGSYGDESAFTRVSLYADWVDLQIENYEMAKIGRATTGASLSDIPVLK